MSETLREEFERAFPEALSNEPIKTALIRGADVQNMINSVVDFWRTNPKWYMIPVVVPFGQMNLYEVGRVIRVTHNFPGLTNGRRLLILGRSGEALSPILELECIG